MSSPVFAATVSWDGGGGNNSWQTAANWSGNVLPGANDEVVIDVAGDITVVHNSGTTTVRSLNCQEGFQLLGGSLTVTAGASTVAGSLRLAAGSLTVRGAGTTFLSSGSVTNEDVTLNAAQGGSLTLPSVQRLVRTIGGDWRISADGTNSVVNLPGLTLASVADFYQLTLTAMGGGRINVPALTQANAIDASADGGGSTIDLAGLSGQVRNTTAGTSRFEALNGGRILAPNVTAFDRVEVYLRNTGQIQTAPLTALTGAQLLLDACTNSFPNLTNVIGNNLTVEAGAKLTLPAVTRLARTNAGTLLVRAWDPGSVIDLPNVTNGVVEPFYRLRLEAADGGRIQLPKLAGVDGAIDALADGAGSVVDLPGVIGRFSNPKAGNAYLEAAAGGAIYITNVTELDRIDVTLNDSGLITLGKVRSFTGALMSLYAATNSFPGITNAEASNFEVDDRARLTLPGLTRLERKIAGDVILTARDNGVLEFPNVTSAQTLSAYQLEAWASTGGRIYLPQLATTDGALIVNANGSNSLVSLTGLSGLLANVSGGPAALEASNGGAIAIPNVTRLDRVDFTLRDGGQITRNQITAIANAKLTVDGPTAGFPLLGDITGSGIWLEDGATLSLPLVTQLVRTNSGPITLRADNASVLDLPNVTSAAVQPFYQLDLLAYDGSRIQLPKLSVITGAFDVLADGTNSVVDLSGLQGVLTTTQAGQSYVEVTSGGAVLMPGVTGFDLVTLTIEGTGQLPTAQLTTLTRSVVTIDGTVAAFPNLGDVTGTTFKYENGGTAAFQPPADFVVSNISAPTTAVANQPVAMAWDVTNIGTALTNGTWSDALYLSADALPGNDVFVGSVNSGGAFPAGATRRFTNNVILPAKFGGSWRVVVVANQGRTVFEGTNFFNNTNLSAASIEVQAPDLVVNAATISTNSAQFGQSVDVTWTVRNAGTAPTTGNWSDRLLLVTNLNLLNQGITLLNRPTTETLAPNAVYTRTSSVSLPLSPNAKGGSYFIVAYADINGALAESKETNNTASAALTLSLPPMPDLAVANLTAPTNALPGQVVALSWAVTNRGTAMATGVWSETLFIVATNANAPRSLLGTFEFSNALTTASFAWRTQQVTLPSDLAAGVSRFGVELDAGQVVAESTETNNAGLAEQTTLVPAKLKWQIAQTNIVESAAPPTVAALITRNGSTASALTVMLESSHPTELSASPSVTIAAGQSSVAFALTAHADGVLDADKVVTLAASAAGYFSDSTTLTVLNSDLPHLALSVGASSIAEGMTAPVTVSRNGSTNSPAVVSLLALGTSQLLVPETVTIPAGATSQVFAVLAQDDSLIESARLVSFQASAIGYVSTSAGLQITDNDLPQFTLTLAATTVSEGAGVEATMATVSRGVASPRSLAVELESSNPAAARVPARVTIPSGQAAVSFPVAVVNDSLTDGPQLTQLRAFALATVSDGRVMASAPVTLTVTDDDGPTLTVVPAKDLVGEGLATATTLAIARNGGTNQPLVVSLASSAPAEATVPATATFAVGQSIVNVPVTTPNDNVSDGSKTVTFTASASGFTSGSATLVVSDRNDADLIVTEVNVPANGESEGFVNVSYRVVNQGFTPAGTNWVTRLLLSKDPLAGDDTVLTDYIFNGTLPVGQFFGQSRQVRLPQEPGDYWIVAVTDTSGQIDEVLEDNNTSVSAQPIHVSPAYQATVQTALQSAPAGTPVAFTGSASKTSTGGPAAFALVNIHINVRGTKRLISALTDAVGNFAATFNPLPGEAGLYEIGAAHPGAMTAPVQDSFTLLGVRADPVKPLRLTEGSSVTGQLALHNPGDLPLTGLAVTVVSNLPHVQVTASLSGNGALPGLASNVLGFAITANSGSAGQGTVVFRVTTAEGAGLNIALPVTIDSLLPRLVANPTELIAGMKVGGQAFVEFEVINNGGATSASVHVSIPEVPWMHVVSANPLPPLAPGATNRVSLHLTPAANLQLGAYDGWLGINAGNTGITVPFSFRALSEAKGDLRITTVDEYTYFAQGSPKVAGATVEIRDAVTEEPVTNGVTDTNGVLAVSQLQEGYYVIELKADQHTSYRDVILVVAGKENAVQAFLRREAVRYIWTVVPTEIEDRTRITIETVFEAFVPMPVVTVDPPLIDLADFTADVTQIDLKVSNHGLIAAKEAKLNFGSHPDWSFEPLISDLGDLPARSSLTVPLLIRRTGAGARGSAPLTFAAASFSPASGGACTVSGNCRFVIECGGSKLPGSADIPVINASASGNCGGGGGGMPFGGGANGGGGGSSGGGGPASSSASIKSCDKCLSSIFSCLLDLALPDIASCAKDVAGCAGSLSDSSASIGDDAYACMKAGLNCAVAAGELLPIVGDALDITECIANISKDCGAPPGGGGGPPGGGGGGGGSEPLTFAAASAMGSATASGVDTIERAELAILRQRAGWIMKELAPLRYMVGNDAWFKDRSRTASSNWLAHFLLRIDGTTVDARKISGAERTQLLAVTLPVTVTTNDAHAFLDRWNRSLDYWAAGITRLSQVPAGQNTNFIAIDVFRGVALEAQEMFAESEAAGFEFPEDGLRQARIDFINFMTEGDSGGVCAHVRLRLDQQAVVTRDAFAATLVIENESLGQLGNIFIDVTVRRRSGEDATALFGIRPPVLDGITAVDGTGVIGVQSSGKATWTLIPTADAVLGDSEEFLVSGVLKYRQDTLDITVPLAPSLITVFPSASLAVKYFHQRDVFADDPFTTEVEPSVPYSLAVMVQNKGRGAANNVRIASAQPQIVENDKGLFADFKIIATEVAGQNLTPSLTVELGRIEPGTNAIGRWLMTSTILGGFIDYGAEFEHLDAIGDKHLSLIEGVQIHELIHIVRAPGVLEDGRPDFLANDLPDLYDRPDTLHLSDGSVAPVSVVTAAVFDRVPTTGNLIVQMNAALPGGWAYLRVPDPGTNRFRLTRVMRSDGVEVAFGDNVWTTDRTFLGNAKRPLRENTLHLFDRDSTGSYTLYYSNLPVGDTNPPVSAVAQLPADSTARIAVNWAGQDNAGGSGVQFFDVYVSTDGGPFLHWQHETLDRTGIFQGGFGRTYSFYSIATDQAGNREAAPLTPDAWTTVTRTNRAPTLAPLADVVVDEGDTLVVQAQANDLDAEDELTFSLGPNAPAGVTINPYTGLLSWVTSEGTGPSQHTVMVQVLDNGLPRLGAVRTFKITVSDDNSPPVLAAIANRTINEGRLLVITNRAEDFDLPVQNLTFSLASGAPAGASINPVSGVFQWQPTETQGGTTNVFRVLVQDDGSPSLTTTQKFSVVVRDTQSDFKLSVGTTNLIAGTSNTLPLELTSSADLGQMVLDLEAVDPHLVNLDLRSLGQEVASASFEPVGGGVFRITVEFDPNQLQSGARTLARLNLATQPSGHSSVAWLDLDTVSASRSGGEAIGKGAGTGGRVFIIENEPLLDTKLASPGSLWLTVYGFPGQSYRLQSSAILGAGAIWQDEVTVQLTGTYQLVERPVTPTPRFYRVVEE